ncbi:MAG TPA: TIGR02206 family membrane protein, partial [Solirubrobacteraceae bacterium]|nr:TIGR02206 family membrane protein [Solirubrobacteraceae bacterium]
MDDWSDAHVAALLVTVAVAALVTAGARRRGDAFAVPVGRGLALVILGGFVGEQVVYAVRGEWSAQVNLPLQLTDAVTLASVVALWRPESALLVEVVYFWALSATVQAVLTPDLGSSFPDPLYFSYFATHSGAIVAACLLVFGAGRLPRPGAVRRVYALTAGVAALAAVGTLATGGNYMFLRRKPAHGSLLDLMGPWPVYIVAGAALGLASFVALAALA